MIPGGKLLNDKQSAQLACASAAERQRLVDEVVKQFRVKRLTAKRVKKHRALLFASSPDPLGEVTC